MRLNVKVTPKAKINKVLKINTNTYHIYTTAAPDKNKANSQVIKLLSKTLNIQKSKIIISKGKTSKNKIISLEI